MGACQTIWEGCGILRPALQNDEVSGNKAVLSFEYAEDGLVTPENAPVKGFLVAGADRRFYPAVAVIKVAGWKFPLRQVAEPVAVRLRLL